MSEKNLNKNSKTDWARLDAMTDEDIDTSDIPPLDGDFFANAELRMPTEKSIDSPSTAKYLLRAVTAKQLKSK